jgi:undecaprenyl diphosphate synthase
MSEILPQHIAVIMDGNGRWAKSRFLPRIAGHKAGLESARKLIKAAADKNIKILTLFAFSSENWTRPADEISALMHLFIQALKSEINKLHENNIQLRIIGNDSRLNPELKKAMQEAVTLTAKNQGMILVVAIDYGGQWDIVNTVQKISQQIQSGKINISDITIEYFQQNLSTGDLPNPDLLIRTSGENRISNFLLWQLAYAELYFTSIYWPDFDEKCLENALQFYATRERRFGGVIASV